MSDLISRQAASDILKTRLLQTAINNTETITSYDRVCQDIAENRLDFWLNGVPPVEQKQGKWIELDKCSNSGYYCSKCHKRVVKEGWSDTVKIIKYCPNCGCRMVEPQESEDKE